MWRHEKKHVGGEDNTTTEYEKAIPVISGKYVCPMCGKKGKRVLDILNHVSEDHEAERAREFGLAWLSAVQS